MSTRLRQQCATSLACALLLAAPAAAPLPEQATFYMLQRGDTIATEPYTRAAGRVEGELVLRMPGAPRQAYTLDLAPDGGVSRTTISVYRTASDTAPLQRATLRIDGDTMVVDVAGGTHRIATQAGAMTWINPSSVILEQALMHARRGGATTIPMFQSAGGATVPLTVTWIGGDSATLQIGGVVIRAAVAPDGRLLGATIPSQQITIVRVAGLRAASTERIDYSAPPGAPYTATEVVVRTPAGIRLAGTLTMPDGRPAAGAPAVVMITGSGPEERDESLPGVSGYRPFRQIADTLSRRGIAVLRLDDRGVGGSDAGPRNPTTADFADDIRAALAYLRTRGDVDARRLGLVGHSEGGMIAPMVAATDPRLKAIVLLAGPAENGRQILAYQQRYMIEHTSGIAPGRRDSALAATARGLDSAAATNAWLRFFRDYDPLATARRVTTPVLILQGATDRQVTADQAETLAATFRAGGNRDVTVHVFPGTDHLFLADTSGNPAGYARLPSKRISAVILGTLADWLSARLAR